MILGDTFYYHPFYLFFNMIFVVSILSRYILTICEYAESTYIQR